MRFNNKNILVTGGNSGIGLATAQAFASEGARVAITGRDSVTLQEAVATLGDGAIGVVSDAGSLDSIEQLATRLEGEFKRIDAVFVNAGIADFAPSADVTEAAWDQTFATNVKGPYFLVQKIAPLMSEGGSIVLNGSVLAHIGMPGSSVYSASKAALLSLRRTLSSELVDSGIRVNVVSPGPISTPIYGRLGLPEAELNKMAGEIQSQVALGRFGDPEDIANSVLHLASDDSSFIVGTEITIDGGMTTL